MLGMQLQISAEPGSMNVEIMMNPGIPVVQAHISRLEPRFTLCWDVSR